MRAFSVGAQVFGSGSRLELFWTLQTPFEVRETGLPVSSVMVVGLSCVLTGLFTNLPGVYAGMFFRFATYRRELAQVPFRHRLCVRQGQFGLSTTSEMDFCQHPAGSAGLRWNGNCRCWLKELFPKLPDCSLGDGCPRKCPSRCFQSTTSRQT